MRRSYPLLLRGVVIATALIAGLSGAAAEELVFIVNARNPATQLSAVDLSNMFLKKKREWPDGTSVRFIDRKEGSAIRGHFLSKHLGKSAQDLDIYWIGQKLYSGNAAPMQVGSDSSVVTLVGSFPGAIGYVAPGTPLSDTVKKLDVGGR